MSKGNPTGLLYENPAIPSQDYVFLEKLVDVAPTKPIFVTLIPAKPIVPFDTYP